MTLTRAAFEGQDGVIWLTVLCVGCWQDLLEQMKAEHKNTRSWVRDFGGRGGNCEFCVAEIATGAL